MGSLRICLDPGHSVNYNKGKDPGPPQYYESNRVFELAQYLKAELEKYKDVVVFMTKTKQTDNPSLWDRGYMAVANNCDVFESIHTNAFDNSGSAKGVSTHISVHRADKSLYDKMGNAITALMKADTDITYYRGSSIRLHPDRKDWDYYGVVRAAMNYYGKTGVKHAFICEHGFHDNPTECKWLNNSDNLKRLAKVKAQVYAEYFSLILKDEVAPQPIPTPAPVDNESIIWNFLKAKGFNNFGIAGLMGNLYAESALRPNNLQNSYETKLGLSDVAYTESVDNGKYTNFVKDSAGYGLAQWTFWSRKEMLLNFAAAAKKSIGDLSMQLDFLYKEISENYETLFSLLKSAKTVREASDAVLLQYERPADQSEAVQKKRAAYGQTYYDKFVVATPAPTPTPTFKAYTVKVNITDLNIRSGPGTNYKIVGQTGKGVFTIVEEAQGPGATKWGKLKSGAGWISLDYIDGAKSTVVKPVIANGDLVTFKGGNYYISSTGGKYYTGKPGKARVTQIAKGAKYPYHLIRTGNETSVYGWVAEDLVSK